MWRHQNDIFLQDRHNDNDCLVISLLLDSTQEYSCVPSLCQRWEDSDIIHWGLAQNFWVTLAWPAHELIKLLDHNRSNPKNPKINFWSNGALICHFSSAILIPSGLHIVCTQHYPLWLIFVLTSAIVCHLLIVCSVLSNPDPQVACWLCIFFTPAAGVVVGLSASTLCTIGADCCPPSRNMARLTVVCL